MKPLMEQLIESNNLFIDKSSYRKLSEIAEQAKRRAKVARTLQIMHKKLKKNNLLVINGSRTTSGVGFYQGVRNVPTEDVHVNDFTLLNRMLYKYPSDGKWGEHECKKRKDTICTTLTDETCDEPKIRINKENGDEQFQQISDAEDDRFLTFRRSVRKKLFQTKNDANTINTNQNEETNENKLSQEEKNEDQTEDAKEMEEEAKEEEKIEEAQNNKDDPKTPHMENDSDSKRTYSDYGAQH
ncbi:hypothetical protein GIB67_006623 [Kingdonia uniflora]|uniref:Uncharacterized protein n=1 Tax=Kingdonia uniflora TaxID=39325 RepID=A0A7J7LER0_9MAGN|nr:hypothetical protein GIB67_006623 [Kingdonia uniflora]